MNRPGPARLHPPGRRALLALALLAASAGAPGHAPDPVTPTGGPQLTFDFPEMLVGIAAY